jgi:hypothetical protein
MRRDLREGMATSFNAALIVQRAWRLCKKVTIAPPHTNGNGEPRLPRGFSHPSCIECRAMSHAIHISSQQQPRDIIAAVCPAVRSQ